MAQPRLLLLSVSERGTPVDRVQALQVLVGYGQETRTEPKVAQRHVPEGLHYVAGSTSLSRSWADRAPAVEDSGNLAAAGGATKNTKRDQQQR